MRATTSFLESRPNKGRERHKTQEAAPGAQETALATSIPPPDSAPMSAARTIPLLVCAIGNPGTQYASTLHSAGLIVAKRLSERLSYSSFQKDRNLGNGLVSSPQYSNDEGGKWTLWQSTAYMNDSGRGVRDAWIKWSRNLPDGEGRLVVVHDELEKPLGNVTVKTGSGSAKGHNGLKSILGFMGQTPFARIGIGIGRPMSRESDDVAQYVLRKMTAVEMRKIEECVDEVIRKLKQLEKG